MAKLLTITAFALAVAVCLICEAVAPQGKPLHEPWDQEVSWTWTPLFDSPAEAKATLEELNAKGTFIIKPVFYVEVVRTGEAAKRLKRRTGETAKRLKRRTGEAGKG